MNKTNIEKFVHEELSKDEYKIEGHKIFYNNTSIERFYVFKTSLRIGFKLFNRRFDFVKKYKPLLNNSNQPIFFNTPEGAEVFIREIIRSKYKYTEPYMKSLSEAVPIEIPFPNNNISTEKTIIIAEISNDD